MQPRPVGKSSITVPPLCLGTMTFGAQTDEATARSMIDLCLERGVNFIDTANVYNAGMRGRKTQYYEGGHRAACFVRWPNGKLRAPGDAGHDSSSVSLAGGWDASQVLRGVNDDFPSQGLAGGADDAGGVGEVGRGVSALLESVEQVFHGSGTAGVQPLAQIIAIA